MSTQGIVSLVDVDNEVIVKAVAGCNGYNANDLAKKIISQSLNTAGDVYLAAINCGFGCIDCLVVMDKQQTASGDNDDLPSRYRETFNNPQFNPRWELGTADYVQVIAEKE